MEKPLNLSEEEKSELLYIVRSYRALRSQASWLTTQIQELSTRLSEVETEHEAVAAREETLYEQLQEKHGLDRNAIVEKVATFAMKG